MLFDRYEIHIQAFGDFIYGKLSFSEPHLKNIYIYIHYEKLGTRHFKKNGAQDIHFRFFIFPEPHICKSHIFMMIP